MRKLLVLLLIGVAFHIPSSFGQIISIEPVFPGVNDTITVTYDASLGTGGLIGVSPVYIHTGLITSSSTSPSDWKFVAGDWATTNPKLLMEDLGNNLHRIKYHIQSYYGVPGTETVEKLAFVFRNGDGTKEGKGDGGQDIFYDLYDPSQFIIAFLKPENAGINELNDVIDISVATSVQANLSMYINNVLIKQDTGKAITYSDTASAPGRTWIRVEADDGSTVVKDSVFYVVRGDVSISDPDSGIIEGINYLNDTTVTLSFYAPGKEYVYVLGDFNDWTPDPAYFMNLSSDSTTFWLEISGLTPGEEYAFQYLVDGSLKIADPYADKVLDPWNDPFIGNEVYPNLKPYPDGKTNDIVSVFQTAQTPYDWQTNNFVRPENKELVIYELLVRDFIADHSYLTLIDTLNYLQTLGVNAIELMPIMEFEGNISWGYNPSYFFAPDKYYGTKNHLKAFIDTCHSRGIAVILDMVLNHAFGQNSLVRLYWDGATNRPAADNPWFNQDATHPFNVGYDFNHESLQTQKFADRVLAYWLTEYRFDGYRMDLSKGFTQVNNPSNVGAWSSYDASRIALLKRMYDQMRTVDSTAYFILEHFADNNEEKELAEYGMMTWGNHVHNYNQATMGYASESNFSGIYYENRGWNVPHLVGYMESHDEERLMFKNLEFGNSSGNYSTKNLDVALDRMEAAAAFFFTVPGPKMIWQFGELGYEVDIEFNGRTGPKPIRWEYFTQLNRRRLYNVYDALIDMRKTYPVFQTDDVTMDVGGSFKRIHLTDTSMQVTILGNFDVTFQASAANFQHTGWWYDYLTGDSVNVTDVSASVGLEPGAYHIYTDKRLTVPDLTSSVEDEFERKPLQSIAIPNPFNHTTSISYRLPRPSQVQISIYTLNGQKVTELGNTALLPAGEHQAEWNAQGLSEGIYFYRIQADNLLETGKLILKK